MTLAARLCFFAFVSICILPLSNAAVAANAWSLQAYLEKVLGGSAPKDIGVIQQNDTRFRVRIATGLLFDAFQLKPNVKLSPRHIDVVADELKDGSWQFSSANDDFASIFDGDIAGEVATTTLKARQAELSGLFAPEIGKTSRMSLLFRDAVYDASVKNERAIFKYDLGNMILEETTGTEGLSRASVEIRLNNYKVDVPTVPGGGRVLGKSLTYSIAAEGLNYKSLKSQIRYGDRIALHSSEGDVAFPQATAATMTGYTASLAGENFMTIDGMTGSSAGSIKATLSGNLPNEKAKNRFTVEVSDFDLVGQAQRRLLLPVIPDHMSASGSVSGINMRLLYLQSNIFSTMGTSEGIDYLQGELVPDGKIHFTNVEASLGNVDGGITLKGDFSVDAATGKIFSTDVKISSKTLDLIIERNEKRAKRDSVAGTLQFFLFFLKGAANRQPDGTDIWAITAKDGKFTLNGRVWKP